MTPTITATYAALLAIFFIVMSAYVISMRARTDIMLGHANNDAMLVAMRRHSNLAEYMPLAIVIMALAELLGLGTLWLHIAGALLIAGRLIHPFGVAVDKAGPARVVGMLATFVAILVPAGGILLTTLA